VSPKKPAVTTTEIYDQALKYSRDLHLPSGTIRPGYTCTWLPENIAALERYREWLSGGGISPLVIRIYHIPMAGHALSLNHKPSAEMDVDHDLQSALDYIHAKGLSAQWNDNCRLSLVQFRRFLLSERGLSEPRVPSHAPAPNTKGLPGWLVQELTHYQHLQQRNWRIARLETNILRFWCGHLNVWRFLVEVCHVQELSDVRRKHLYDYAEQRLSLGKSVSTINADLRNFHSFMGFLQEEDYLVPQALLRLHGLKQPERLPKYLTDEQVKALRDEFEGRVVTAVGPHRLRDALLDQAIFYLFWQSGLRLGEVEELRLEDLNLTGRKLTVRNGKGMKDRTVYLTDTTVQALTAYLPLRWLVAHFPMDDLRGLTPKAWYAYLDARLASGINPKTLNHDLGSLKHFVFYLQEHDRPVCERFLLVDYLEEGTNLPKDVPIDQLRKLQKLIQDQGRVTHAGWRRIGRMDLAWFLLMLHSGLRTCEVRSLRSQDIDWEGRRIRIEQSKNMKDRMVYLSQATVDALQAYLEVRGVAEALPDFVFIFRHRQLTRSYFFERLRTYCQVLGIHVHPHQLRHSCATLLLNSGAPVLTVQTLLGHKWVDTTLGYARLYDGTVANDYYQAMAGIEKQLALPEDRLSQPVGIGQLLAMVDAIRQGTLTEAQSEMIRELRAGLMSLADQANLIHVVKVQTSVD
jgi:site-specific recombinase XerD